MSYFDDEQSGDPVATAYGSNYARLQPYQEAYGPQNFFYMKQTIRPAH